ncbi:Chitinase 1 [Colletotrichum siamense]|nr:Chitinase 1 [Colletotrichum siamense]
MIKTTLLLPLLLSIVGAVPMMSSSPSQAGCSNPDTVIVSTVVTRTTQRGGNASSPPTVPSNRPVSSSPPTAPSNPTPVKSSPASNTGSSSPPASSGGSSGGTSPASGFRNVLYFTNWGVYGANYQPSDLPADKVTHLLYSFADISSDGTVISSDPYSDTQKLYPGDTSTAGNANGCVGQIYALKKKNRKLKVVLSIGGWTWSPKFVPVAATAAGRQTFASSAVKLMADWGFDGIDIDWEYPASSTEAANFVALLKACREALDAYAAKSAPGYHFVLTVACPAGPSHYQQMDLRGMDAYVDAWHLMAYDYAGSWDTTTGHQANVFFNPSTPLATKFSTEVALTYYLAQGIRSSKIVLGMPLYGRSFLNTDGIGLPYSGVGAGSIEKGVWHYNALPRAGAKEIFDEKVGALYSYDSSSRELVSYDNVQSANYKTDYMKSKSLGGAVFWEAAGDKKGDGSLVAAVAERMGSLDSTQNLLSYPGSQYANIRGV